MCICSLDLQKALGVAAPVGLQASQAPSQGSPLYPPWRTASLGTWALKMGSRLAENDLCTARLLSRPVLAPELTSSCPLPPPFSSHLCLPPPRRVEKVCLQVGQLQRPAEPTGRLAGLIHTQAAGLWVGRSLILHSV